MKIEKKNENFSNLWREAKDTICTDACQAWKSKVSLEICEIAFRTELSFRNTSISQFSRLELFEASSGEENGFEGFEATSAQVQ